MWEGIILTVVGGLVLAGGIEFFRWLGRKGKKLVSSSGDIEILAVEMRGIKAQLVEMDTKREKAGSARAEWNEAMANVLIYQGKAIGEICACVCNGNKEKAEGHLAEADKIMTGYLTSTGAKVAS